MKTNIITTAAIAVATFAAVSANAINPYPTDAFEGIAEQSLQLESWMFAAEEIATEQTLQLESWMFVSDTISEDSLEVEPWMLEAEPFIEPALELESWMF